MKTNPREFALNIELFGKSIGKEKRCPTTQEIVDYFLSKGIAVIKPIHAQAQLVLKIDVPQEIKEKPIRTNNAKK